MDSDTPPLQHKESQDTLISLMQLDPSPIDSPSQETDLPPLPEHSVTSNSIPSAVTPSTTSSIGLSGTGRGPIYYLTRIQRYSSYTFTAFAALHLANTSLIPLVYKSVPYSEPFLLMTRELYQTRISEPLLVVLPVVAHIASGLAIRLIRRNQHMKRYGGSAHDLYAGTTSKPSSASSTSSTSSRTWPFFSYTAASGYAFTLLLSSHVAMNRVLPLVVDGDSSNIGLAYVSHGFARHPASAWVAYILLLSVSVGHMVWGMAKWLDLAPPANWKRITFDKPSRRRRRRAWWAINAAAASLALFWAAGGLGVVARAGSVEGWLGTVYDGIYAYAGR
ncbi:hypothetical protein F5Y18DRAFT_411329 [Xylariaceae sp. FL1019]|nr:hypothetical protein F5Y18DRAFT_411329 [Xylariaceae sp. FL1019]